MRYTIVGAGAMGSIIAGYLSRSGEEVILIARGERGKPLEKNGITITGLEDFNNKCTVITDPKELSSTDTLIFTVKTYHMEEALSDLSHVQATNVFSVQNGVAKNEQMADVFGKERTMGAAAYVAGEVLPDGSVNFSSNQCLYLGELPEGVSSRVSKIVGAFEASGIHAEAVPQVLSYEWTKFRDWTALASVAVLTRLETYKIFSDPNTALTCAKLYKEIASLAASMNVSLLDLTTVTLSDILEVSEEEIVERIRERGEALESSAPTHRCSALQDLERARPLEVEDTLGYIIQTAKEHHVAVPTLETCYRLCATVNSFLG